MMWLVNCILGKLVFDKPLFLGCHIILINYVIIERRYGSSDFIVYQHKIAYPTISKKS